MPYYGEMYIIRKSKKMTPEMKKAKKELEAKYKAYGLGPWKLERAVANKMGKMFPNW